MKILNKEKIEAMFAEAAVNPRRRINCNFHEDLADPVNRLCIAALPGSQFSIHRHPGKWEMLCGVYGRATSRWFDDAGKVIAEIPFGTGENFLVEIPAGTWHTLEILTPFVFYEVKSGPFVPAGPEDTLILPEC